MTHVSQPPEDSPLQKYARVKNGIGSAQDHAEVEAELAKQTSPLRQIENALADRPDLQKLLRNTAKSSRQL